MSNINSILLKRFDSSYLPQIICRLGLGSLSQFFPTHVGSRDIVGPCETGGSTGETALAGELLGAIVCE